MRAAARGRVSTPGVAAALAGAVLAALLGAAPLRAAEPAASGPAAIYTCIDDKGRKLTSDRPIADCLTREQRVLNRDGSLRKVQPPTPTADERAEQEAAERRAMLARAAQADAVRRDRNLMIRFPNEAAHREAREAALDTVRMAARTTELRLKELAVERKPLLEEAEFYRGRQLPARLRQQLDANDAAVEAQRSSTSNQEGELVRINRLYDLELEHLKKLWAGAQPGTVGSAPQAGVRPGAARNGNHPAR